MNIYTSYLITAIILLGFGWMLLRIGTVSKTKLGMGESIDQLVESVRARIGEHGAALLISLVFFAAAAFYTRPVLSLGGFGEQFAALAKEPFGINPAIGFPHRILTPLLSYLLFLRGELIIITNVLAAWLVLYTGYRYFRSRFDRPVEAVAGVAILAFSLVTLNSMFNSGYTDSITSLLLLLMWWVRSRPKLFWLCFLLALFNRESVAFMIPWFVFLRMQDRDRPHRDRLFEVLVGLALSLGTYGLFRYWLAGRQDVVYSLSFYLKHLPANPIFWLVQSGWYQFLGLFTVFKTIWIVPIIAGIRSWRENREVAWSMLILLGCTWAQFVIAYDSSRLFTQGFLIVVIAIEYLFSARKQWSVKLVGWSVALGLFVPQWYTAAKQVVLFRPLPTYGTPHEYLFVLLFALVALALFLTTSQRVRQYAVWGLASVIVAAFMASVYLAGDTLPVPWPDEAHFLWQSVSVAEHGSLLSPELNPERHVLWMPPGYMSFIGGLFAIFGNSLALARFVSLVCMLAVIPMLLVIVYRVWPSLVTMLVAPWFLLSGAFIAAANIARMEAVLLVLLCGSFLLLAAGRIWIAIALLLLTPLIHPNGLYFIPFALLLAFVYRQSVDWKLSRMSIILFATAFIAWIVYLLYISSHWDAFVLDMQYQFGRKAARPLLERILVPEALFPLASLILSAIYGWLIRNKAIVVAVALAMPAWLAGWIGLEMWYDLFVLCALLIVTVIAARLVCMPDKEGGHVVIVLRWVIPVGVLLSLVTWNVPNYTSRTSGGLGFPTSIPWKGMNIQDKEYLTDADIEKVTAKIKERIRTDASTTIQFFPSADAFFYLDLRSEGVNFSEPLFTQREPDLFLMHLSRTHPSYFRFTVDRHMHDLDMRESFLAKYLIHLRDTTEQWFLIPGPHQKLYPR